LNPKVSVIIPVYNGQKYIAKCIHSLLTQTYENIEIIVVDDGSVDESARVIKGIYDENERVKYLYQENGGPGKARNRAIQGAKGKYILFVDADDYLSDDYIGDLVYSAEKNGSDLTIGGYTLVYEDAKKDIIVIPKIYKKNVSEEWAYRISSCCSRLYLKSFWDENGLYFHEEKSARAEDVPIVLYSNIMAKDISIVKNAGYFYYQHKESAMNNSKKRVVFDFPYDAFAEMYHRIKGAKNENSIDFFNFGVLKCLAFFEFVIYRKASGIERKRFKKYISYLLNDDLKQLALSWKKIRSQIELPLLHRCAIWLFIFKYCKM